ncbi:uncharacterized protein LOC123315732 [Coccinella septempunctata]|uniref:uncharacterized protein LOC123315732 n=1 Tax=Coccinella septempunctata TaxID=41139 RepID=UPI001D070C05|nr:uncharacterized protein LOC123315732 [Coccinella septempunctata]
MWSQKKGMETLKEILKPLSYPLFVHGLVPYDITNTQVKYSKLKLAYGSLVVCSMSAVTIMFHDTAFDRFETTSSIIKFIIKSNIPCLLITLIGSFLTSFFAKNKLNDILKELELSDVELWNMSRSMRYLRNQSRSKKWSFGLLGFYLVYMLCIIALNLVETLSLKDKERFFALLAQFPVLNKILVFISFLLALTIMEERFTTINAMIRMKIDESLKHKKYPPVCETFSQDLQRFVCMHIKNSKLTEKINSLFSLCLLLNITATFLKLIGSIHLILCKFVIHSSHDNIGETLELCVYTIFNSLLLFLIAQESKELNYKATETRRLLLGIDIHPDKEEAYESAITAALRLMQSDLNINACNLFNIDNTLIFSCISAGSTYLFVMMQYELEYSKNNKDS